MNPMNRQILEPIEPPLSLDHQPINDAAFLSPCCESRRRSSRGSRYGSRREDRREMRGEIEDHHPRGGEQRHHRQRQGQNPRQGRNLSGSAATDLRGEAARGWEDPRRLQHPERVDAAFGGADASGWDHRALSDGSCQEVQPGQDDLPQVEKRGR